MPAKALPHRVPCASSGRDTTSTTKGCGRSSRSSPSQTRIAASVAVPNVMECTRGNCADGRTTRAPAKFRRCACCVRRSRWREGVERHLARPRRGRSRRIDDAHGDHAQRGEARHEEIVAAARRHELRYAAADEGRAAALGIDGNDELGILAMIARERAGVVAGVEVEAVLDPLLLHELELPEQTGADADEDDAVIA